MTNAVDIICESCETRMQLSEGLLAQIAGRSGRVTCKQCARKVGLDASGPGLKVTYGGYILPGGQELDSEEPISTSDPHLSEFPVGVKVTVAPPISDELKDRRRVRAQREQNVRAEAAQQSPQGGSVAQGAKASAIERGSLSPHTFADEQDDDGLVPLGQEFHSTPYVNERDSTFQSLYPEARDSEESESPEVRVLSPLLTEAPLASVRSSSQVAESPTTERRRSAAWVPWSIAAAALFGLGVSLSMQVSSSGSSGERARITPPAAPSLAVQPQFAPEHSAAAPMEPELELIDADALSEVPAPEDESDRGERVSAPRAAATVTQATASAASAVVPTVAERPYEQAAQPAIVSAEAEPEPEPEVIPPFSTAAAGATLSEVTARASSCRSAEDPSGVARIQVTFAPSGRVTQAVLSGPPFAGTATGSCIASRFREATVPPFSGEYVTVSKTVTIH